MAARVFWWETRDPAGSDVPLIVAVHAESMGRAATLTRAAGFHGLKSRNEQGPPPEWVTDVPLKHSGRVCWCSADCAAEENWMIGT